MIRASRSHAAAQKPSIRAVLVANSVFVQPLGRLAGEMRVERLLQRNDVIRMNPVEPVFAPADA